MVTLDTKFRVADRVAGDDDQVVEAIGALLDRIDHRLAETSEEGIADPWVQRACRGIQLCCGGSAGSGITREGPHK